MDSGANAFMFPPVFLVEGTYKPSLHCLISDTSGPVAESLDHGTVIFGLIDPEGHTHCFRESVYIHDALPFALFPVSCLSERGVYFDFYSISNLFYGSVVFPFAQRAGLYMGKLLCAAELSAASVMCAALLSPFGYHIALVVKTRSSDQHVSNSAFPLAEIEISSHCASPPDNGVPLVLVKDGEQAVQEGLILDMPPRSSEVLDTTLDTGCINQLRHRLTGAGKLVLDLHDRRGHPHDRALKQMVDSKQSGCEHLSWVPGIHIRDHCWACLKGQQRRSEATFNSTLLGNSPLTCQVMVLDWCGPHHVTGFHGSLYWLLSVCPYKGYHWAGTAKKKSEYPVLLEKMLRHVRGKVGDDRIRFLKFDGYPEFTTEPSNAIMRAWKIDYDQSCYQVGEVERGHSIHQNAMRTMCPHAHSASLLWEELFKALDQNPGLVRDCFGMIGFRHMVGWKLVHHRVRKCFSGTWFIGVITGYKIRQMWFVVEYSDGMEAYTPTELSPIYFSGSLSKAFYLAFDIPVANIIASLGVHIAVDYNWPLTPLRGSSVTLGSLMHDAAYSVDAVDLLSPLFACFNLVKSAVYRTVAHLSLIHI